MIIEYLKKPPTAKQIKNILNMLSLPPQGLMRTKDKLFLTLKLGNTALTDKELIELMASNPALIERPIVINGDKAALCRPPEKVKSIL